MSNIKIDVITITPEMAAQWLEKSNTRNRSVSEKTVKAYADDIINNRWELTGQGISFYDDGVLADGQHRLHAIIMADKPTTMTVTKGLLQSAINGIDQHRARAVHDTLTLKQDYGRVTATDVAALRLCYPHGKTNTAAMEAMLVENYENLSIVNQMFGAQSTKTGSAIMRATVLLALADGEDKCGLAEFVDVLVNGITTQPHHKTVVLLRDMILQGQAGGGEAHRRAFMRKSQLALSRFLKKQAAKRLSDVEYYTYPLLSYSDIN